MAKREGVKYFFLVFRGLHGWFEDKFSILAIGNVFSKNLCLHQWTNLWKWLFQNSVVQNDGGIFVPPVWNHVALTVCHQPEGLNCFKKHIFNIKCLVLDSHAQRLCGNCLGKFIYVWHLWIALCNIWIATWVEQWVTITQKVVLHILWRDLFWP
jgi:hypothetical protein